MAKVNYKAYQDICTLVFQNSKQVECLCYDLLPTKYLLKKPENFIDVYKELSGEKFRKNDTIFRDTSSVILKKDLQNDVSYITKDNKLIIMMEHQSIINKNMAIRFLFYYVELLTTFVKEKNINLFSSVKANIPSAEFYVAYNGVTKIKESKIKLTDNFSIELNNNILLNVKIKDINYQNLKYKI